MIPAAKGPHDEGRLWRTSRSPLDERAGGRRRSGKVVIQSGNRKPAKFSAGHIFGEMALIDVAPRSVTAGAKTDVELVPISEKQFLLPSAKCRSSPNVKRVLESRLRATSKSF